MKKEILNKFKYVYHRGFYDNKEIPENSLLAFEKSLRVKKPIELDLHLLKDNTIVVFHDNDLKRMTGINKKLKDCTYEEIKNYKLLNTNQRIPTLVEVLELVNGKVPLDIEMKYDRFIWSLEKRVVKILDNYKGDFVVKSFHPMSLIYFRLFRKKYIRGQLVCNFKDNMKINHSIFNILTNPDFVIFDYKTNYIKKYKKTPTFLYTINETKTLNKYINEYDGFIIENIQVK